MDLTQVGGRRLMRASADGGECWDFGFVPTPHYCEAYHGQPTAYDLAPHIKGAWDGKTSISHWLATKQVKGYWPQGEFLPAQRQPRGTCVARGGSGALNVRQAIQLVILGSNEEFKPVSHSALYGEVRELGGITGNSDGAMGADAAKALARFGAKHQAECGEPVGREGYYSDTLAVQWGAGRSRVWTPDNIKKLGSDNLVEQIAPWRTFQEYADGIASLAVATVASDQGFTMTRDSLGCCRPSGTWMHQMYGAAVIVLPTNADVPFTGTRAVAGCGQSWGDNVPDGPLLKDCPDYVFGVDADVWERMGRQGDSMLIFAFQGWKNPSPPPVIPWATRSF